MYDKDEETRVIAFGPCPFGTIDWFFGMEGMEIHVPIPSLLWSWAPPGLWPSGPAPSGLWEPGFVGFGTRTEGAMWGGGGGGGGFSWDYHHHPNLAVKNYGETYFLDILQKMADYDKSFVVYKEPPCFQRWRLLHYYNGRKVWLMEYKGKVTGEMTGTKELMSWMLLSEKVKEKWRSVGDYWMGGRTSERVVWPHGYTFEPLPRHFMIRHPTSREYYQANYQAQSLRN